MLTLSKDTLKKMILDYIVVQVQVALSLGIVGSIFASDVAITYSYFFLPAIIGFICMLPCIITYVKEDLTIKQMIVQRVVEWVVLEFVLLWVAYKLVGDTPGKTGYVVIGFSILLFDVVSYGISYFLERREADDMNRKLRQIREKEANQDLVKH